MNRMKLLVVSIVLLAITGCFKQAKLDMNDPNVATIVKYFDDREKAYNSYDYSQYKDKLTTMKNGVYCITEWTGDYNETFCGDNLEDGIKKVTDFGRINKAKWSNTKVHSVDISGDTAKAIVYFNWKCNKGRGSYMGYATLSMLNGEWVVTDWVEKEVSWSSGSFN